MTTEHGLQGPRQRELLATAERVNALLRGDVLRDSIERVSRLRDRVELRYGLEQPLTDLLRPAVFPAALVDDALRRTAVVARVLRRIADNIGRQPDLAARIGFPQALRFLLDLDGATPSGRIAARADGFFGEEGRFEILEYNAMAPGGMYESDALRATFLESLLLDQLSPARVSGSCAHAAFDALVACCGRSPRIALILARRLSPQANALAVVHFFEALKSAGMSIETGVPGDLGCNDRGVTLRDEPVDMIVVQDPGVLSAILFTIGSEPERLVRHLREGTIRFLNGLAPGAILSTKSLLAVISEGSDEALLDGVPAEALAIARDSVPWTRRLVEGRVTTPTGDSEEIVEYALAHREELVVKPLGLRGGAGVLLGWTVTPDAWAEELGKRLPGGQHLLQRRVRPVELPWPRLRDGAVVVEPTASSVDIFVWRDDVATLGYSRTVVEGFANQARGAMASTIVGVTA
jgi:hypothetical protein